MVGQRADFHWQEGAEFRWDHFTGVQDIHSLVHRIEIGMLGRRERRRHGVHRRSVGRLVEASFKRVVVAGCSVRGGGEGAGARGRGGCWCEKK